MADLLGAAAPDTDGSVSPLACGHESGDRKSMDAVPWDPPRARSRHLLQYGRWCCAACS